MILGTTPEYLGPPGSVASRSDEPVLIPGSVKSESPPFMPPNFSTWKGKEPPPWTISPKTTGTQEVSKTQSVKPMVSSFSISPMMLVLGGIVVFLVLSR